MKKGDRILVIHTGHEAVIDTVDNRNEVVFIRDLVTDNYVHARFKDVEMLETFEDLKARSSTVQIFNDRAKEMKEKIMG